MTEHGTIAGCITDQVQTATEELVTAHIIALHQNVKSTVTTKKITSH